MNQLVSASDEIPDKVLRTRHVHARLACHPTKRTSSEQAAAVTNSKEGPFGFHLLASI